MVAGGRTSRALIGLWVAAAVLLVTGAVRSVAQEPATDTTVEQQAGAGAEAQPQPQAQGQTPSMQEQTPSAAERIRQARELVNTPLSERATSVLGLFVLLLIAWALSVDRRTVQWRVVLWGVGLQIAFAVFILKTALGAMIFSGMNDVIVALLGFTIDGARFLFGNLVFDNIPVGAGVAGTSGSVEVVAGHVAQAGASFAFNVLPTIIFFSSLMTLLYYLGIMQWVVKGVAWVMMRTMHTSGAETLSTAGNIFVGQTEAPLLIKPFVEKMTMSELMVVMTGGFATVAGGVMAAYVGMLVAYFPDIAGHLLAASVMSAPAALVVAKLMYPEREEPVTASTLRVDVKSEDANVIDAAARGAGDGLRLALNVGAMLLAFIALIALLNAFLGWFTGIIGLTGWLQAHGVLQAGHSLTLEHLLGWIMAPVAWIMGVPWHDAATIGSLLGVKTVVNEFVAYLQLKDLLASGVSLSPRSVIIATYALAGFANFSSIAIQIGGIGGIAPSRRSDLSRLGLRAMIAGTIAAFMTATIAGILI